MHDLTYEVVLFLFILINPAIFFVFVLLNVRYSLFDRKQDLYDLCLKVYYLTRFFPAKIFRSIFLSQVRV